MGLIWGTILFVLGGAGAILIPVIARVVSDDVKEWLPWITERLVERAVSQLPEQERDRFEEEWWAHIDELPGNLAKAYVAWGCLSAAKAINHIALSGHATRREEATRRAIDVTIAALVLLLTLPLMVVISIFIKLDSPGPVFSKHKRLGANNIPFHLLKFRSMCIEVRGQTEVGYLPVTRVGRVIRITSLDELPQLLNVLRGQMSLVGPRALTPPSAADASAKSETPILRGLRWPKPGITGWAQIHRWEGKAKTIADLYYLRNRSLRLDFFIIARTVFAVMSRDRVAPASAPYLVGIVLAIAYLIGLVLVIAAPIGLVLALTSLTSVVNHFLGL
jgi:putative colanic acid biosynthesis UDP-glucose lipid carrier transferase